MEKDTLGSIFDISYFAYNYILFNRNLRKSIHSLMFNRTEQGRKDGLNASCPIDLTSDSEGDWDDIDSPNPTRYPKCRPYTKHRMWRKFPALVKKLEDDFIE